MSTLKYLSGIRNGEMLEVVIIAVEGSPPPWTGSLYVDWACRQSPPGRVPPPGAGTTGGSRSL